MSTVILTNCDLCHKDEYEIYDTHMHVFKEAEKLFKLKFVDQTYKLCTKCCFYLNLIKEFCLEGICESHKVPKCFMCKINYIVDFDQDELKVYLREAFKDAVEKESTYFACSSCLYKLKIIKKYRKRLIELSSQSDEIFCQPPSSSNSAKDAIIEPKISDKNISKTLELSKVKLTENDKKLAVMIEKISSETYLSLGVSVPPDKITSIVLSDDDDNENKGLRKYSKKIKRIVQKNEIQKPLKRQQSETEEIISENDLRKEAETKKKRKYNFMKNAEDKVSDVQKNLSESEKTEGTDDGASISDTQEESSTKKNISIPFKRQRVDSVFIERRHVFARPAISDKTEKMCENTEKHSMMEVDDDSDANETSHLNQKEENNSLEISIDILPEKQNDLINKIFDSEDEEETNTQKLRESSENLVSEELNRDDRENIEKIKSNSNYENKKSDEEKEEQTKQNKLHGSDKAYENEKEEKKNVVSNCKKKAEPEKSHEDEKDKASNNRQKQNRCENEENETSSIDEGNNETSNIDNEKIDKTDHSENSDEDKTKKLNTAQDSNKHDSENSDDDTDNDRNLKSTKKQKESKNQNKSEDDKHDSENSDDDTDNDRNLKSTKKQKENKNQNKSEDDKHDSENSDDDTDNDRNLKSTKKQKDSKNQNKSEDDKHVNNDKDELESEEEVNSNKNIDVSDTDDYNLELDSEGSPLKKNSEESQVINSKKIKQNTSIDLTENKYDLPVKIVDVDKHTEEKKPNASIDLTEKIVGVNDEENNFSEEEDVTILLNDIKIQSTSEKYYKPIKFGVHKRKTTMTQSPIKQVEQNKNLRSPQSLIKVDTDSIISDDLSNDNTDSDIETIENFDLEKKTEEKPTKKMDVMESIEKYLTELER